MSWGLSRHRGDSQSLQLAERPRDPEHPSAKVEDYMFEHKLGQGTFGIVYKGICKRRNKLVAIKHVLCRVQDKNLSITTVREITTLKHLKHENIIELVDVISDIKNDYLNSHIHNPHSYKLNNVLCMVFPYMSYDLTGILQNPDVELTEPDRKSIMYQLFQGIDFIHQHNYLHRDIKASNILINKNGILKIGDFGLVRHYRGDVPSIDRHGGGTHPLTEVVMTRWYRAPEVLFANRKYGTAVDIWGIGCVFGELFEKLPILKGETDIDQGIKIFQLCGAPSPTMFNYDRWRNLNSVHPSKIAQEGNLKERFGKSMSVEAVQLLKGLLQVDPRYRFTTAKALESDWFHIEPKRTERVATMFPECHEADAIRQNKLERAKTNTQPSPSVNYNQSKSTISNQGKSVPHNNDQTVPKQAQYQPQPPVNYPPQQYPPQYSAPLSNKNYNQSLPQGQNNYPPRNSANSYGHNPQKYFPQRQQQPYPKSYPNQYQNYNRNDNNNGGNFYKGANRPNRNFIPDDQRNRNPIQRENSPRVTRPSQMNANPRPQNITPTKPYASPGFKGRQSQTYQEYRASQSGSQEQSFRKYRPSVEKDSTTTQLPSQPLPDSLPPPPDLSSQPPVQLEYKQRNSRENRDSDNKTEEPVSKKQKVEY